MILNEKEKELRNKLKMIKEYNLILSDEMISKIYDIIDELRDRYHYSDEDIEKIIRY